MAIVRRGRKPKIKEDEISSDSQSGDSQSDDFQSGESSPDEPEANEVRQNEMSDEAQDHNDFQSAESASGEEAAQARNGCKTVVVRAKSRLAQTDPIIPAPVRETPFPFSSPPPSLPRLPSMPDIYGRPEPRLD